MSKSVLVIDTPENCYSCCLRKLIRDLPYCEAKPERIKDSNIKPDWCSLKPLPDKMKLTGVYGREYFQSNGKMPSYKIGWNDCLDAIKGENNNE